MRRGFVAVPALGAMLLAACASRPQSAIDPVIEAEIQKTRAIDNHAHPALVAAGDRDFDALPVDGLEPMSDPVGFRPGAKLRDANRALFGAMTKVRRMEEQGEKYPAWVLDQLGMEAMLANRVEMGKSIQPPRFRWVGYVDALMFPADTSVLAARNSDRKAFLALEDKLLRRYLDAAGLNAPPATLGEYLSKVVTPLLERHKQGGAVAEKFEAAYLRSLHFDAVERADAERVYARFVGKSAPGEAEYKPLQDYIFRYIAAECGRLGMAVHIHTSAGAGSYFDVGGANPMALEPVFNDPGLRKTNFVMLHGGWPFTREITALTMKPNAYVDFSVLGFLVGENTLAGILREWLEFVPEKVLFGTDAYPYGSEMGWEETAWISARSGRQALGLALTAMVRDGEITLETAQALARLVLRENAKRIYGI